MQRYYSDEFIKKSCLKNRFSVLGVYEDLTVLPPEETGERIFYVIKKM